MSQLGAELQEPQREPRTILGLLSEQMEGGTRRRRTLKERFGFGFMGMGCCGATWGLRSHHDALSQTEREQQQERDPECVSPGMNLAAALAAERQLRGPQEEAVRAPWRVSLMRLLEEAEAETEQEQEKEKGGVAGNDSVCCVCMGRKKGAAFIPCGHTFCRVCSRELCLNRGSCPLCNRSILEILHIF